MNDCLKIGIRAHDLDNAPFNSIDELINELKKNNLHYVQLVFKKAFKNFSLDENNIQILSDALKENEINVAMLGAYFNMIHPDIEKRRNGLLYFKECQKYARMLGTKYVGSETGSANGDKWTYNPFNHTDEAYEIVKETTLDLIQCGNAFDCQPIIEGAYNHVIYNPSKLKQLVDETNLNNVTIDIFNFLNIENYQEHTKILDDALKLLKDKITIFHLKDFIIQENKLTQVGLGQGLMDYDYIIPKIKENCPHAILILEGITKDDIAQSLVFLRRY